MEVSGELECSRCAVLRPRSSYSKTQLKKRDERKCRQCVQTTAVENLESSKQLSVVKQQKPLAESNKSSEAKTEKLEVKKNTKNKKAQANADVEDSPVSTSQTQDFDSDSSLSASENKPTLIAKVHLAKTTPAAAAHGEEDQSEKIKVKASSSTAPTLGKTGSVTKQGAAKNTLSTTAKETARDEKGSSSGADELALRKKIYRGIIETHGPNLDKLARLKLKKFAATLTTEKLMLFARKLNANSFEDAEDGENEKPISKSDTRTSSKTGGERKMGSSGNNSTEAPTIKMKKDMEKTRTTQSKEGQGKNPPTDSEITEESKDAKPTPRSQAIKLLKESGFSKTERLRLLTKYKGQSRKLIRKLQAGKTGSGEEAHKKENKKSSTKPTKSMEPDQSEEEEESEEEMELSRKQLKKLKQKQAALEKEKSAKSQPLICDKCDGKHETSSCPHYKKPREKHPDAQRRKAMAGLGGAGGNMFVSQKDARVYPQPGDGSCLYHSMFRGLRGKGPSSTHALRQALARWVRNNAHVKIADTPVNEWVRWDAQCSVEAYCRRMQSFAWGGGIEMAAFSRLFNIQVDVYERTRGGYKRISCFLAPGKPERCISVLYCGGIHYDAIEITGAKQKLPSSSSMMTSTKSSRMDIAPRQLKHKLKSDQHDRFKKMKTFGGANKNRGNIRGRRSKW